MLTYASLTPAQRTAMIRGFAGLASRNDVKAVTRYSLADRGLITLAGGTYTLTPAGERLVRTYLESQAYAV